MHKMLHKMVSGNNNTIASQFSIESFVNTAPSFTSTAVTSINQNESYNYTIATSDNLWR